MGEIPPSFVERASGKEITIIVTNTGLVQAFQDLGFVNDKAAAPNRYGPRFTRTVIDESQKGEIFTKLRDMGICFSRGREWNPAEVFEYLMDKGLLNGNFQAISWQGPDKWQILQWPWDIRDA